MAQNADVNILSKSRRDGPTVAQEFIPGNADVKIHSKSRRDGRTLDAKHLRWTR